MRARIRDTEIFFDIEGAGLVPDGPRMRERPAAFVIHGGPGSDHSGFKPALSPLAERMQLVYFDHRGQGRSARGDPATYTLDENVEDMEALRLHLGLGPIVSIGTSYGGMVAMAHAARHPGSVSHLILVATAAHGGFIARARKYIPLIVPVFMMAIRSADNLAMALESKAFGAHRPRTSFEEYRFRRSDIAAIIVSIALFVACVAMRIAGFGSV